MKTHIQWLYMLPLFVLNSACSKSDFLNKKPITTIISPSTLNDLQHLLDNETVQYTGGLAQLADDDYSVPNHEDLLIISPTERNSYIWAKDIYESETTIQDWNNPYSMIFYSNCVLDGLNNSDSSSSTRGQYLKGWALFNRAYAFYDLTRNFCKAYDVNTASSDLGIPLRLKPGIDIIEKRATLQQTFNQILSDLAIAEPLLPADRPGSNLNRPSKIAVYALLSRIYLDMRNYVLAEAYSRQCLNLYSVLIDYNSLNQNSNAPFNNKNPELIYNTSMVNSYELTMTYQFSSSRIARELISSYSANDLRLTTYYKKNGDGISYTKKSGYYGASYYPFTGLAVDEVYLINAECQARIGDVTTSMKLLNQLLITRYLNTIPYLPLTATSPEEALRIVLLERRKELVFRALRWHDLKRINKEGANITLKRTVNGVDYKLPPNDPRWVFPIPNDEIILSGIPQNVR